MSERATVAVSAEQEGEQRSVEAGKTRYIYVKSKVPLDSSQQAILAFDGITFLGRIDETVYRCRFDTGDLDLLRRHDFVVACGDLLEVAPGLDMDSFR